MFHPNKILHDFWRAGFRLYNLNRGNHKIGEISPNMWCNTVILLVLPLIYNIHDFIYFYSIL